MQATGSFSSESINNNKENNSATNRIHSNLKHSQMSHSANIAHFRRGLITSTPTKTTDESYLSSLHSLIQQNENDGQNNLDCTNTSNVGLSPRKCSHQSSGIDTMLSSQCNESFLRKESSLQRSGKSMMTPEEAVGNTRMEKRDTCGNISENHYRCSLFDEADVYKQEKFFKLHAVDSNNASFPVNLVNSVKSTADTSGFQKSTSAFQERFNGDAIAFNSSTHVCHGDTSSMFSNLESDLYSVSVRIFNEELIQLVKFHQDLLKPLRNDVSRANNIRKNFVDTSAKKNEDIPHWRGVLPVSGSRCGKFSRKLFLGGLPWNITRDEIVTAFSRFGKVTVVWPKDNVEYAEHTHIEKVSTKGYCHLIFESDKRVSELLDNCFPNPNKGGCYFKISRAKFGCEDVQVIPWVINDNQYIKPSHTQVDVKRTVFVRGLHAVITADLLAKILDDSFGNVVFAALETDKYKYPTGSARVAFANNDSYIKAVTNNYVNIHTVRFNKLLQLDPYLEDSICQNCFSLPGILFCRELSCFKYFCPYCWNLCHNSTENLCMHKPLTLPYKSNVRHQ